MSAALRMVINRFTPKPDCFEEFIGTQVDGLAGMRGRVPGLLGSRFYREENGREAVLVSVFESDEALAAFQTGPLFAAHVARLRPLLETAVPARYQLAYEYGAI